MRRKNMQNQHATGKPSNSPLNQPRQPSMTEEKIKELIVETLIELDLITQPHRKKALTDV